MNSLVRLLAFIYAARVGFILHIRAVDPYFIGCKGVGFVEGLEGLCPLVEILGYHRELVHLELLNFTVVDSIVIFVAISIRFIITVHQIQTRNTS